MSRARSEPRLRALAAPIAAALLVRVVLWISFPIVPSWDGVIYERAADSIAEGDGLTLRALDPDGRQLPTAFYPIGFPAWLAALRSLGAGDRLDLAAQVLAGVLLVPVASLLGRRAAGARGGRIAAWIAALWPGGILLSLSWMSEPLFTLLIGGASLVVAYSRRSQRARALAIAAIVLGLAAHVRPTALPILAVLAVGVGWSSHTGMRGRARAAAMSLARGLAIAAVVLTPWTVRNVHALGGPAVISTNGGSNLLLGTLGEGYHGDVPTHLRCAGLPEIESDRCRAQRAIERIAAAPGDQIARALLKIAHTFGHESGPAEGWARAIDSDDQREPARLWALGISRLAWLGLFGATFAGAALLLRRRWSALHAALFAPIVGIALLHALTIGGDRYHAPAAASFAALAALAIVRWTRADRS
jgi:hypothetical protein